ncbi:hypothetical protein SAMN05660909_00034 [Chitinophaga terrae (ex Kim and Jung 2007)]|uniref:Uncharacterized protein n=1 Tax=Chitinophaga terrae (ex Kim and Jung 2007) TaxID=408074 RepID=A0A1H3WS15_9BACT|nr:hypothetical protein [Chitinophaga terrae (ex Kim and Jung 2007)]SDZ89933.1 hypothetical protein SAMN05660909_00034 [Chitinophaga terrae (ex Kim and Jung 2007)]
MLTPVQSFTYHTRAICSHESYLADYTCKAPCKASIYMDVMMYCAGTADHPMGKNNNKA